MSRIITAADYDRDILAEGLEFQVEHYYQPRTPADKRRIRYVLEALELKCGELLLDIGCGVGTFSYHGVRAGARCVGVDYSFESVRAGRLLCERFGCPGARFLQANALRLPFSDRCFDRVVAADFIEHITDTEKSALLREIGRVLKKGGRLVVFTPNGIREKLGAVYWEVRSRLCRCKAPANDLHYGLISAAGFRRILRKERMDHRLLLRDITRPLLARVPLVRKALALNLLFVIDK